MHVMDHMGLGGAQTIVRDLVEKNSNHRVFSLRYANNPIKFSNKNKHKIITFKGKFKYDIRSVLALKKEVQKYDIQVLHAHLSKAIFIVYLYKLFFRNNIKVIITEHGAVFSKKRFFYRFLLRRVNRFTNRFIAVSKKIKQALINTAKIDSKKIEVVYNFIDFDDLNIMSQKEKTHLRKSLNFTNKDFLVGFVGRLTPVKSLDTLIEAYPYFKDKNTKILIIGDGELRDELQKKASTYPNIIFLGFREDIKQLYQILDIIVLSSVSEASPMAFYESQVYGIPFIGSNVYAINEFIKHNFNGLLFELKNKKDFANKIIQIRDNKNLRDKISQNAKNNLMHYDIKIYNKKMQEIYNE